MTRLPLALAAIAALGAMTTGCTTDRYGNQQLSGAGRGAAIGAAGGAVVGALTGNPLLGAAIGAAGGAVVGAVADDHNRYEDRNGRRYYYESDNRRYHYENGRDRVYDPY
jgi:uncharacterized protein YqgC (DUF456 family)